MKTIRSALVGLVLSAAAASAALANQIPPITGPTDPSQFIPTINSLIQSINSYLAPQNAADPTMLRNYLDNGEMRIAQRGTGAATCGTTSGLAVTSYGPDRWGCDVNVSSGAGQLSQISSSPTPPPGFGFAAKLVRNSGALTQPQCAWQVVPSERAQQLQGSMVVFSSYMQALGGLSGDNGNAANLVIITGTASNEGFGALRSAVGMTASPAITPAWTGIATLVNTPVTLTTGWVRYQTPSQIIATTVKEIAVGLCFTPTANGSGATDGFAFTGTQLEPVQPTPLAIGQQAGAFEFHPQSFDQLAATRFYWQVAEVNGQEFGAGACQATNTPKVPLTIPTIMDTTPVLAWTVGGFSLNVAGAAAAAATGGAGANLASATTWQQINLSFTNTCTAGGTITLVGTNTTGLITLSADF